MKAIKSLISARSESMSLLFEPILFRLNNSQEKDSLEKLLEENHNIIVLDELDSHLRELIKINNPARKLKSEEYPELIDQHLAGKDRYEYGVWVYYPWSKKLVHLLDKQEFIKVRTNRNKYKLTDDEQEYLSSKKIGIIGLSVGQSIALTTAMERICGEIRLADFDIVELSNLNRIRSGVQNLCLKKTILAAREIYEIDPFLKVKVFNDGITNENIDEFFSGDGKLDLLVEVCDGLDIKIQSRFKARELHIPVLMDTNDRGMLDIERFDLEPDRPIMHGLAGDLDPQNIKDLTNEEKIPYILKMVGAETISTRLKASMMEVEQSINTWPQLASSVMLGGAITTDIARKVLLNQLNVSGRYYIDFDELIKDSDSVSESREGLLDNPHKPLTKDIIDEIAEKYLSRQTSKAFQLSDTELDKIAEAFRIAPSAGNNQPWKLYYKDGYMLVLHDKYRSWSWGDYAEMGALMGIGTAIENIHLQSALSGLTDHVTLFPDENEPRLIAAITFAGNEKGFDKTTLDLAENFQYRCTNRKLAGRKPLPEGFLSTLEGVIDNNSKILFTDDSNSLDELGQIMSACDRIRLLHPQGHKEFYSEVRWSKDHAAKTNDGIELAAVDLSQGDIAGFYVAQDWKAVSLLSEWNKGTAFRKFSEKTMSSASGALLVAIRHFTPENLVSAGRDVQRLWISANMQGVSVHPMLSPVFFFSRLVVGKGDNIPERFIESLKGHREKFLEIFPLNEDNEREYSEVFLMKLSIADDMGVKALRKPKNEIFYRG